MAQLTGSKKIRTAVFISGKGSNLKSLIKFSKFKKSPISIEIIISNNPKSKGLVFGKIYKIKKKTFNFKKKSLAENEILEELRKKKINLICLAGFMKVLSKNFIKRFKGKILNIHPSLLPRYKGLNTHERAIRNNDKYSGCTVHFVNSLIDSGKIIDQKKVKINKKDTPKTLAKRVLLEEHKLYPRAILKIFSLEKRNLSQF
jgi:phosphoribosylglycinamide formyltransferase-1